MNGDKGSKVTPHKVIPKTVTDTLVSVTKTVRIRKQTNITSILDANTVPMQVLVVTSCV